MCGVTRYVVVVGVVVVCLRSVDVVGNVDGCVGCVSVICVDVDVGDDVVVVVYIVYDAVVVVGWCFAVCVVADVVVCVDFMCYDGSRAVDDVCVYVG